MRRFGLQTVILMTALMGCAEDQPLPQNIEHMRVLGAKSSVVGEPQRATPMPGEETQLSWTVVHPSLESNNDSLRSLFFSCTYPDRYTGIPICQELLDFGQQDAIDMVGDMGLDGFQCPDEQTEIDYGAIGVVCLPGQPDIGLRVPESFSQPAMLVRGVICAEGVPSLDLTDPSFFTCDLGGAEAEDPYHKMIVHGSVQVAQDEARRNLNPDTDPVRFEVQADEGSGEPRTLGALAEDELPAEDDCLDVEGLPLIDRHGHRILVTMDADDRELVDGEPEVVEFAVYTTLGELEARFIVFEPDDEGKDGELQGELLWTGPERDELGDDGKLVRFFFTPRDRRGGYDVAMRSACVHAASATTMSAP